MSNSSELNKAGMERAILSIILRTPDKAINCIAENLYSEHFGIRINSILYSIIMFLTQSEGVEHLDSMLIYNAITDEESKAELNEIGGLNYIDALVNACVADNLLFYIKQIKKVAVKRMIFGLGERIVTDMLNSPDDEEPTEYISRIQSLMLELIVGERASEGYRMGTGTRERLRTRAENPNATAGYMLGWSKFDEITQGFVGNDLCVIVGESKTGKSTLLLNMAERLSSTGLKGLYIDTEMNEVEQEDRLIAMLSQVPFQEIRNGKFNEDTEFGSKSEKATAINRVTEQLENTILFHEYLPSFTIEKVTALVKQYKIKHDIDYCIFDYIKLPTSDVNNLQSAQEYQRLGYFTTCLKDLAGVLNIPIITACQSNRTNLGGTTPDASSIGGSYRILQYATKLLFIRNKQEYEMTNEGFRHGNQVLRIGYQRHGAFGIDINMQFDRPILRIKEVS